MKWYHILKLSNIAKQMKHQFRSILHFVQSGVADFQIDRNSIQKMSIDRNQFYYQVFTV